MIRTIFNRKRTQPTPKNLSWGKQAILKGYVFVLLLFMSFCITFALMYGHHSANAQFFQPAQAPQVGDLPAPNAGVQAQNQGYFNQKWWKAGRYDPVTQSQEWPAPWQFGGGQTQTSQGGGCLPLSSTCTQNSQCCSGNCQRFGGVRICN